MTSLENSVKVPWYTFGIPKALYFTAWISLSISLCLSLFDLFRWIVKDGIEVGSFQPMRMITTICFILSISVIIVQHFKKNKVARYFTLTLSVLILTIAGLSMLEFLVHFSSNSLTVLTSISVLNWFLSHTSRMALLIIVSFILIGVIFILLHYERRNIAHGLVIPVAMITYFFLLTYILKVYSPVSDIVPLSLNTSIAMAGICIALIIMYPDTWLMRVFTSGSTSAVIARQLLIPLMVIPIIVGWLRITGERYGIFSSDVGVVIVALVYTSCFTGLIWLTARSINKIDKRRIESEEITAKSHARMELLSNTASRLLMAEDPQKIINDLCGQVKDFLNCELFFNFLVDDLNERLHLNAYSGISKKEAEEIKWIDFGSAVCGCVAKSGERIISECVQESHDVSTNLVRKYGVRAYACHPLLSHDKVIGTLSFGAKNRDRFSRDDLALMKIIADQVAIAMARLRNEKALRESEDRFRTIAESLAVPIGISRIRDSRVVFTNDAYNKTFGYKKTEVIGKKARDFYLNPDDRNKLIEILNEKSSINNFETQVIRADGKPFWVLSSVRKIIFEGEPAFLSALVNIDQLKKAQKELLQLNRTLNALGKSSQAMMHTSNELQYLSDVCRIIIEDCGYLMVWIGYARNDENKTVEPMAYYGLDHGYIERMKITWSDNERGRGPTGTAIRTGKPAICRDMQNDPDFAPWREDALKKGYASSLVLPLIADDKVFGAINIYSTEQDAFKDEDIKMLSNLADDLAYGITYIRLLASEKNAAKAIKESEEKYRLLFDEMTEGFSLHEIILDDRGRPHDYKFISVNPAFEIQTGIKAGEVIGRTAREVLPGIENHWIETYGKVALTGESIEFENYSSDLNSYYHVSAFSPSKGYFAVIFENITKRVLAEKELQRTKNYLENLIDYANAPIVVWDTETKIQLFNHAFEHLTGYASEEVLGKRLDILFPEASMNDSNEKIKIALTRNWETIEIPILTKNKQVKTILWNSANILDPVNGKVLSTIAQGNDITDRIKAENEVRTAKDKLDLAMENANIGIWNWDIKNDLFEWDERISIMFGLDPVVKNSVFEDFEKHIHEEDVPHFTRALSKALQEDNSMDTIFRSKQITGEFRYINTKARVERDVEGKPVKMTGVFLDITSMQKAAESTLFDLNEDLLRSNKELEQFAYVASHDLQEPLRMVSSFTQLLSARYHDKLDKQAQEFIDFAVDGAQRMQRLINDLLQYSRIKTRGKTLSVVDMNDVFKQTVHNLSIKIKEKKAVVSSDPLPTVLADDSQMVQLFQNLIENGIKFCEQIPKIHISAFDEKEHYRFLVKDNGIGIEPKYFDRIFQIFQRLHLREEYGGTGIGLAICKRIVERHGGRIWAESKEKGTQFQFTIRKVKNSHI